MGIREGANSFVTALENEIIQTRSDLFAAVDELGVRVNEGFARQQNQINEVRDELHEFKVEVVELLIDIQRRLPAPPAA